MDRVVVKRLERVAKELLEIIKEMKRELGKELGSEIEEEIKRAEVEEIIVMGRAIRGKRIDVFGSVLFDHGFEGIYAMEVGGIVRMDVVVDGRKKTVEVSTDKFFEMLENVDAEKIWVTPNGNVFVADRELAKMLVV